MGNNKKKKIATIIIIREITFREIIKRERVIRRIWRREMIIIVVVLGGLCTPYVIAAVDQIQLNSESFQSIWYI